MSAYWYCDSVNVCEFPVAGSITVKVVVFGDRFSKYTCVEGVELDDVDDEEELWDDEEELVDVDVDEDEEPLFCELDEDDWEDWVEDDEELCELDDDWEELLLCELDDVCCSIWFGEEYSTLKAFPSYTTVSTEVG